MSSEENTKNEINTENEQPRMALEQYLTGFDQPEKARAFFADVLTYPADGEQWAVGGFVQMLEAIANQPSIEDARKYAADVQAHLLSEWATGEMPESVRRKAS